MIAAGVFAGAPMPIHWLASKSGTIVLTVGTSGRSSAFGALLASGVLTRKQAPLSAGHKSGG